MSGLLVFESLSAALLAGYHVYDRADCGYIVRMRTDAGYAMALVRCRTGEIR